MSESLKPEKGELWLHADGDEYRVIGFGKLKHPDSGDWLHGVVYENITKPGELFSTTLVRWHERFKRKPTRPFKEVLMELGTAMHEAGIWDDLDRDRKIDRACDDIRSEYAYALDKWGSKADDEKNRPNDFVAYIAHHSTRWFNGGFAPYPRATLEAFRREMVKVGGLALAAILTTDKILKGEIERPDVLPPEEIIRDED